MEWLQLLQSPITAGWHFQISHGYDEVETALADTAAFLPSPFAAAATALVLALLPDSMVFLQIHESVFVANVVTQRQTSRGKKVAVVIAAGGSVAVVVVVDDDFAFVVSGAVVGVFAAASVFAVSVVVVVAFMGVDAHFSAAASVVFV